MGYFSNGTEGEFYVAAFCSRCRNYGTDRRSEETGSEGCAVWDAHLFGNYEDAAKTVLDILIPRKKDGGNEECAMFRPIPGHEDPRQELLPEARGSRS